MKHTDFYARVQEIKRKEQQELCRALEAHGGSYSWWNTEEECFKEDEEHPIIAVNVNGIFPNPTDIEIRAVSVDNGFLSFVGEDKENGDLVDFQAWDVFAGHLGYVIDLIPNVNGIDDVTSLQDDFVISTVSRDDLIGNGFNAENLSDDMMKNVAAVMGDLYAEYEYTEELRMAADKLNIPKGVDVDAWFGNLDFATLEKVTGFIQTDYSPEDGYQDFVDVCEDWWSGLTMQQRKEVYESNS